MEYNSAITTIVIINGIYNIVVAFSILDILRVPSIGDTYFNMITDYDNNNLLFERFAAYYMLSNGLIRVYNGQYLHNKMNRTLVSGTFILDAIIYFNEMFMHHIINDYSYIFSIIFSIYLGYSIAIM